MIFLLCLLIILLCIIWDIKWTKQEIAHSYGVCKKTLSKWVLLCCPKIDHNKWKRIRKLNILQVLLIWHELGFPEEYKTLSKGEILERCETYYHTIRKNVALNLKKLGINENTYLSLDVFPPKLSSKIVELIGE